MITAGVILFASFALIRSSRSSSSSNHESRHELTAMKKKKI
jgi:hypothetical protein